MKQVVLKGQGQPLAIEERETPEYASNELLVKVRACGICGTDVHMLDADWVKPNTLLGHEFAGEVAAIGDAVRGEWQVGDRVGAVPVMTCGRCAACLSGNEYECPEFVMVGVEPEQGTGAFAEYVRVRAFNAFRIPDSVTYQEAALVEPLVVGLDGVRRARLRQGDSVLIVGAGPIGLTTAQWCKFFGARDVVVSEFNPSRRAMAETLGATATIDPGQEKDVLTAYRGRTGTQPSVIFEVVGIPGLIQQCIEMAQPKSRIVVLGVCQQPDTFKPMDAVLKQLTLEFAQGYTKKDFEFTLEMMRQGRIAAEPMITHEVGFDQFLEAFEAMKRPKDQCKVLLVP